MNKAIWVDKIKYNMVPLLSATELAETDATEKLMVPYKRVKTNQMGLLLGKGLEDIGIAPEKWQEDHVDQRYIYWVAQC